VPTLPTLIAFGLVSLGMALTPGPNMLYLISRSICQGRRAGLVSLGGVALGFVFYMFCAAFGITALLLTVPYAYDALRFCGAAYLLYLAWQALRPAVAPRSRSGNCRTTAARDSSQWASSRTWRTPRSR
jgi:threonine/homoserine/homoserine lactone efflux protein